MTDVKRDDERMPEQGIEPYGQADNAEERAFRVAREAIDAARGKMTRVVHSAMVEAYWTIGKEISDSVGDRAEYGKQLIAYLSRRLTTEYGKGFSEASLRNMRQFYRAFPIRYTLSSELSWSHYTSTSCVSRIPRRGSSTSESQPLRAGASGSLSGRLTPTSTSGCCTRRRRLRWRGPQDPSALWLSSEVLVAWRMRRPMPP